MPKDPFTKVVGGEIIPKHKVCGEQLWSDLYPVQMNCWGYSQIANQLRTGAGNSLRPGLAFLDVYKLAAAQCLVCMHPWLRVMLHLIAPESSSLSTLIHSSE